MGWELFEYAVYAIVLPILISTSIKLALKQKLHGNMRFNVSLMTLSVIWMLLVRIVQLISVNWENSAEMGGYCYYAMQAGYNWYRGSFFSFIIERFVCAMTTNRYEHLNSIAVKLLFGLLTAVIVAVVLSLVIFAAKFFNTFAFAWMFTMQSSTIPMTAYVLRRTRQDWSARHEGASLSQRFQIAESRASAKLFLPLTASNFLCVLFLLGVLAAIAFGNLEGETIGLCYTLLDWLDFYQRLFYIAVIVRTEGDCWQSVAKFFIKFRHGKFSGRRNTISVTPIQSNKADTEEYFKNYKNMWG
ncbi:unnamed protein product, partial [Mesorhabditis spiculigera]